MVKFDTWKTLIVGSVSLKNRYFSSKREGALVFVSNCSSFCKDYISEETHANFNLAHPCFCHSILPKVALKSITHVYIKIQF